MEDRKQDRHGPLPIEFVRRAVGVVLPTDWQPFGLAMGEKREVDAVGIGRS